MVLQINRKDSVKIIVRGELFHIDVDVNGTCEFTVELPCTTSFQCLINGNELDYNNYVERIGARRYKVTEVIQVSL